MHLLDNIDNMEKIFDSVIAKYSKNQLLVLRVFLQKPNEIVSTNILAKKTKILQKHLGGVMSALSRKRIKGQTIIEPMGKDDKAGLRWRLVVKALTHESALIKVKQLLSSYS